MEPSDRIAHQLDALTGIANRWQAACAIRIKADGINWRVPGLEQLDDALHTWAHGLGIPLLDYTTREVRATVAGQPNASRDAVCYAIMHPPRSHRPEPHHRRVGGHRRRILPLDSEAGEVRNVSDSLFVDSLSASP